ncbi:MAG: PAS domain-containing protein [Puniceicoccaceae bacterium]
MKLIEPAIPEYGLALPEEHPVRIYLEENAHLGRLLDELEPVDPLSDYQLVYNLFNQVACVDIRYTRKENQLFPYLEKRGWYGPSQGMWSFQDENRKLIKQVRRRLESGKLDHLHAEIRTMIAELRRMREIEESRLFPLALEILLPEDWEAMKHGESEIGWMHRTADASSVETAPTPVQALAEGILRMNEGTMTLEQINLMLQFIPFDLTYVDENDRVLFYNRGEDRVFPRSAGVIGREVRFCHPPKSVGTVLEILDAFRAGNKDEAEFWIRFKGRMVHIRYFAIRDAVGTYRGVIEVSQDITDIQKLEGEKRLLDWD